MKVTVVGAGFSGLVTAYYLKRKGLDVEVVEKNTAVGGYISTVPTQFGLIETAANALLNSEKVEDLFKDLGVVMHPTRKAAKKRYIFRKRPKQWPLGIFETLFLALRLVILLIPGLKISLKKRLTPKKGESVAQWSERNFSRSFLHYLIAPALQGIYAGDPNRLSATLILGRFFSNKKKSRALLIRGSIAPKKGMGQLMEALKAWLTERGVSIRTDTQVVWNPKLKNWKWVIAVNASDAARILTTDRVSQVLQKVELSPIVSITAFFHPLDAKVKGFGVLFPRDQGVRALGVLMNNEIFEHRSDYRSETWIYGGALDHEVCEFTDVELMSQLLKDRRIVERGISKPLSYRIQRWPAAIPHYTIQLEKILSELSPIENTYLMGNYLGALGLGKILERAEEVATLIFEDVQRETPARKVFHVPQERSAPH